MVRFCWIISIKKEQFFYSLVNWSLPLEEYKKYTFSLAILKKERFCSFSISIHVLFAIHEAENMLSICCSNILLIDPG